MITIPEWLKAYRKNEYGEIVHVHTGVVMPRDKARIVKMYAKAHGVEIKPMGAE